MNITVLVDAHNLLHALIPVIDGFPRNIGDQRKATANLLSLYAEKRHRRVIAFVDGGAGPEGEASMTRPNLRAIFTQNEGSADDAIADYLFAHGEKGKFLVVSSDREVAGHGRAYGANTQSSQEFALTLAKVAGQKTSGVKAEPRSQYQAPKDDKVGIRRRGLEEIEAQMLAESGDLSDIKRELAREAQTSRAAPKRRH